MPSAGRTSGSLSEPMATPAPSFGQLILNRVKESGPMEAFRKPDGDGWKSYTWDEMLQECSEIAAGLVSLGAEMEDRIAIASGTRLDWIVADYGIMLSGAATTTVYPSTEKPDVQFILEDSGTTILIAEDQSQADKADGDLPRLRTIILMDGDGDGDKVLSWSQLREKGKAALADNPNLIQERVDATGPDKLATLIYTSGTTGKPKGVELTHSNWTYEASAMDALGILDKNDVQFLWLPLAHSFGKVLLGAHLQTGGITVVDGRVPKIVENLPIVRPTLMAAVPRIFEKVYAGVQSNMAEEGGVKEKLFNWAFKVGRREYEKKLNGENYGGWQLNLADKLIFSKVRERLGGNLRYMVSGSAALSAEINEWFDIVGMPILEGYGLTETSAATCVNRPESKMAGTVGQPLPGTEIKIADDGEIMVRGGGVMRAYRHRDEANEEVFGDQAPGPGRWFATGDIGVIDDAGRIKITDRKKDLVKTSGGKYIAPGAIEAQFKAKCGIAGAVCVIANERNFASALVALDPDSAAAWADKNGKAGATIEQLANDDQVKAEVQAAVDALNSGLNRWETIKQFRILPKELTIEGGELTPSLKVKRKVVEKEFADMIDGMYTK
ncbi:MAG: long-chain fatty acid--CoA ligase [Micrococcales bacterium]|nr:long-chain fatty acid--CoA ligase [Micrococcales bacterium]